MPLLVFSEHPYRHGKPWALWLEFLRKRLCPFRWVHPELVVDKQREVDVLPEQKASRLRVDPALWCKEYSQLQEEQAKRLRVL